MISGKGGDKDGGKGGKKKKDKGADFEVGPAQGKFEEEKEGGKGTRHGDKVSSDDWI